MWRIHHLPLIDCCLRKTGASYRLIERCHAKLLLKWQYFLLQPEKMLESSSLRYFVLTFPRHSIVPEKTTHLEFFFHMRYGGKCFTMHPLWCPKAFLITFLGHDIGVVQDHLCSVSFSPSSFEAFLITLSLQDAREILIPKRISQFSGPLRLDMLQYTVAGPIQAAQNNTKCVHRRRAHKFFGNNFIQNC